MEKTRTGFEGSMDDDFNTAGALGNLFDLVRVINQSRADGASEEDLMDAQKMLRDSTDLLGLTLGTTNTGTHAADAFIDLLVEVRAHIRENKLWELSDMLRDRLDELGVHVEDEKTGSTWAWK